MFAALLWYLLAERALELVLAERNRRWAKLQGGRESGQWHYPIIIGMHALFYLSLAVEGKYLARGWNPLWPVWLALLVLAQALRVWAIASLGRFWNTRIVVVPGFRPVVRGPYRFIRHPNYLAVVIEIFAVSVLCGAYLTALVFSALNAVVLHIRIREEEQALAEVAGADLGALPRFVPARLRRFRS